MARCKQMPAPGNSDGSSDVPYSVLMDALVFCLHLHDTRQVQAQEKSMTEAFVIAPHMRLHEWVAVEKGYFDEEGWSTHLRTS